MILGNEHIYIFLLILPIVSFLYASVGHGGASGYLALMALFSFAPSIMKPTALLLNLFVAAISFYYFYKGGFFNKRLFLLFAISSIPLAFLGGTIEIDASIYKKILAVLLIFAILKMLNVFGKESNTIKNIKTWQGLLIGGIIGFFFRFNRNWRRNNIKSCDIIISLGKDERSCSSFSIVYLGKFCFRAFRTNK